MCLTLRVESYKPYNDLKIRYKVLKNRVIDRQNVLTSEFVRTQRWRVASRYTSQPVYDLTLGHTVSREFQNHGFHVFANPCDAMDYISESVRSSEYIQHMSCYRLAIMAVDGFIASGYYGDKPTETWRDAFITDVFNPPCDFIKHSDNYSTIRTLPTDIDSSNLVRSLLTKYDVTDSYK